MHYLSKNISVKYGMIPLFKELTNEWEKQILTNNHSTMGWVVPEPYIDRTMKYEEGTPWEEEEEYGDRENKL